MKKQPLSLVKQMAKNGEIQPSDSIKKMDESTWKVLSDFPGLDFPDYEKIAGELGTK